MEHGWGWAENFGIGPHEGANNLGSTGEYFECGGGHSAAIFELDYRIVEWDPDLSIEDLTADELLCANAANVGTTRSAWWSVEFWSGGAVVATTQSSGSLPPGAESRICASNPLDLPLAPITITARAVHPWDADGGAGNDVARVSYGGLQTAPVRGALPVRGRRP